MNCIKKQVNIIVFIIINLAIFLSIILTANITFSEQLLDLNWVSLFGGSKDDEFTSIVEDHNNYISVGISNSNDKNLNGLNYGFDDAIIVKYNSYGEVMWKRNFGGSGIDKFNDVVKIQDGSYIAVGGSNSKDYCMTGINKGCSDAIIVKYNKNGEVIWQKSFGGSFNEEFSDAVATHDGGFVAIGTSNSTDKDMKELSKNVKGVSYSFIVYFDSDGNIIWKSSFGIGYITELHSIITTSDKNFILVGFVINKDKNNIKSVTNAIIIKYNYKGSIIWSKLLDENGDDYFYSVSESKEGYIYVVGASNSKEKNKFKNEPQNMNAIIVKYSLNGDEIWRKVFGGNNYDIFCDLKIDKNDNIIVVGMSSSYDGDLLNKRDKFNNDGIVLIYNKKGELMLTKVFGGESLEELKAISINDGNIIIAGNSASNNINNKAQNKGRYDSLIALFKVSNFSSYSVQFGGSYHDSFKHVIETKDKSIIAVGESRSRDGDMAGIHKGGTKCYQYNYGPPYDAIIVKYTKNGKILWKKSFGGTFDDSFNYVIEDPNGNYVAVGWSKSVDGDMKHIWNIRQKNKNIEELKKAIIVCFNNKGDILWKHVLCNYSSSSFNSLSYISDKTFVVVGEASIINKNNIHGLSDALVAKYNLNGELIWIKQFGEKGNDIFYSITNTKDYGFIVAGTMGDTQGLFEGNADAIIVKFNSAGKILWKKMIGYKDYDVFYSIKKTKKETYIIAGSIISDNMNLCKGSSDAFILEINENGKIVNKGIFGGSSSDGFIDLMLTQDNEIIAVGYSLSNDKDLYLMNRGNFDIFMVKMDCNFNIKNKLSFGGSQTDNINSFTIINDNEFILCGESWSKDGDMRMLNRGSSNAFLLKVNID